MKTLVILATGIGLGGSAAATYRAHRKPMSPQWDEPVGDTRLRRSDLPIGGAVAMTLAFGSLVTGHRKAAAVLAGAGLGATAGSLGVALLEPLADTEPQVDDFAADPDSQAPWQPPAPQASGAASADTAAGDTAEVDTAAGAAGAAVLTPGSVTVSGLSGASLATLADLDDALGGLSTDTADGLAAEAHARASLTEHEQKSDQAPEPGAPAAESAPPPDPVPPSSATDLGDDDEAEQQLEQAEEQLERAEEAVEHQAFYGSASLDDADPESVDEPASSQAVVTGSAPQEGQLPAQDT